MWNVAALIIIQSSSSRAHSCPIKNSINLESCPDAYLVEPANPFNVGNPSMRAFHYLTIFIHLHTGIADWTETERERKGREG